MNKKTGIILLAVLLLACAAAVGLANEKPFVSSEAPGGSGEGGPPDWAPEHARVHWEWSQTGDDGPPPWVPEHARKRWEWSQSGEDGPPPWASGNDGEEWERPDHEKGGPPEWIQEHIQEKRGRSRGDTGPPWLREEGNGS